MKLESDNSVALKVKLAYAAPAFALAIVGIPVYVYIPKFYTDVVGINSTILAVVAIMGQLIGSSISGFGFARMRFPGRTILFMVMLSTLFIGVR
mgnify:CR=1 FL=1